MATIPVLAAGTGGVLIASPSTLLREQVLHSLPEPRGPVQEALGGADALVKLETGEWQLLFLDRRLPDLDAEELIQIIQRRFPGIEVVLLDSDSGQPLPMRKVCRSEAARPRAAEQAPREAPDVEPLPGMIGGTEAMMRVYRLVRLIAPRTTTVLIAGATGTGKELVARALHALSPRAARPLVVVNCAAIPEALLESELFGYARGSFTGAVQSYSGRIPAAHGGTLFLDEVGELPLGLQAKLLRFLEQKEIQRLGSAEAMRVDVRVLAASNANLARRVEEGQMRQDLYYRLSVFPLELPPLRERTADIVPLAEHFLALAAAPSRRRAPVLSAAAIRILEAHRWAGNVRELQHVMERSSILADDSDVILPEHLYFPALGRPRPGTPEPFGQESSVKS